MGLVFPFALGPQNSLGGHAQTTQNFMISDHTLKCLIVEGSEYAGEGLEVSEDINKRGGGQKKREVEMCCEI